MFFTSEIAIIGRKRTEQQEQRQEQTERSEERSDVDQRRPEVAPAGRQEVAVQAEVAMMTKRSNHMPMFTKMDMTNMNGDVRAQLLEPEELRR